MFYPLGFFDDKKTGGFRFPPVFCFCKIYVFPRARRVSPQPGAFRLAHAPARRVSLQPGGFRSAHLHPAQWVSPLADAFRLARAPCKRGLPFSDYSKYSASVLRKACAAKRLSVGISRDAPQRVQRTKIPSSVISTS